MIGYNDDHLLECMICKQHNDLIPSKQQNVKT